MSEIPSYVTVVKSGIQEYEKLVYQMDGLVPRNLEKDLLKVYPTANYKATKEYILEQASLKRDGDELPPLYGDCTQLFDRLWPIVGLTDFGQTDFGQKILTDFGQP